MGSLDALCSIFGMLCRIDCECLHSIPLATVAAIRTCLRKTKLGPEGKGTGEIISKAGN